MGGKRGFCKKKKPAQPKDQLLAIKHSLKLKNELHFNWNLKKKSLERDKRIRLTELREKEEDNEEGGDESDKTTRDGTIVEILIDFRVCVQTT